MFEIKVTVCTCLFFSSLLRSMKLYLQTETVAAFRMPKETITERRSIAHSLCFQLAAEGNATKLLDLLDNEECKTASLGHDTSTSCSDNHHYVSAKCISIEIQMRMQH